MQSKDKGLWCGLEWNHPGPKYERPRVFVWSQQANTASKATPTGTLIKIEGWVRHQQLLLGLGLNSLCDNVKAWAFWQKNPRRHRKVQQVEILRAHRHYCTDHPSLPPPLCASMISTMVKAPRRKNTTCQHLSRRRVEKNATLTRAENGNGNASETSSKVSLRSGNIKIAGTTGRINYSLHKIQKKKVEMKQVMSQECLFDTFNHKT